MKAFFLASILLASCTPTLKQSTLLQGFAYYEAAKYIDGDSDWRAPDAASAQAVIIRRARLEFSDIPSEQIEKDVKEQYRRAVRETPDRNALFDPNSPCDPKQYAVWFAQFNALCRREGGRSYYYPHRGDTLYDYYCEGWTPRGAFDDFKRDASAKGPVR